MCEEMQVASLLLDIVYAPVVEDYVRDSLPRGPGHSPFLPLSPVTVNRAHTTHNMCYLLPYEPLCVQNVAQTPEEETSFEDVW